MSEDHREADEEQLGQQVTRSDYLWRTEWEWTPLGGRGRKGGAARSRAADYSDLSNNVGDEKLRTSLDGLAFPLISQQRNAGAGKSLGEAGTGKQAGCQDS